MENKLSRNMVSVVVITMMVASTFALPIFNDDYAVSAASKIKAKYVLNGGKLASKAKKSKSVTYGKKYGKLTKPTKTGYTFKGWYTKNKGGKKVTAKTKVSKKKAHKLYARWTAKTYTVKFEGNGGTASVSSKKVTYNSKYDILPYAESRGKVFKGWYTAKTGGTKVTESTVFKSTGNVTLYAQWFSTFVDQSLTAYLGKTPEEIFGNEKHFLSIKESYLSREFYLGCFDHDFGENTIFLFNENKKCIAIMEHTSILFSNKATYDNTFSAGTKHTGLMVDGYGFSYEGYSYSVDDHYALWFFEDDSISYGAYILSTENSSWVYTLLTNI